MLGSLAAAVVLLAAFFAWERARRAIRCSSWASSAAPDSASARRPVSLAFFALLGGRFALTQYLQFAHGYSAIQAGAIMSPMALGLMLGAGSSSKASDRFGASRVIATGLSPAALLVAAGALDARHERDPHSCSGSSG